MCGFWKAARNFAIRGVRRGLENRGGSFVSVLVCSLMTGRSEEASGVALPAVPFVLRVLCFRGVLAAEFLLLLIRW